MYWPFDKLEIPKEIRIGYTIERVEQFIPAPCGASGVKNSDITKTFVEDVKCVGSVVKEIQTIQRVNVKCANYLEQHPAFSSTSEFYKR